MALAALLSTSSAINASLYAVTNVTYQLARLGELPSAFGDHIVHSRKGLIISSLVIMAMALLFDLSSIAAIGAVSMLIIHMIVHIGHLRLLNKTGASRWIVLTAVGANLGAIVLATIYLSGERPMILVWISAFFIISFLVELGLRSITGRVVTKRVLNHEN